MGMVIRSEMFPIRARLNDKTPWELTVEIENEDEKPKKVSLDIRLPQEATLSPVSMSDHYSKKFETFRPFEKFKVKIPVYLSRMAEAGNHRALIKVCEHFQEFGVVEKEFRKEILFRIVK